MLSILYSDRQAVQAIGRIDRGADQNEGLKGTLPVLQICESQLGGRVAWNMNGLGWKGFRPRAHGAAAASQ